MCIASLSKTFLPTNIFEEFSTVREGRGEGGEEGDYFLFVLRFMGCLVAWLAGWLLDGTTD